MGFPSSSTAATWIKIDACFEAQTVADLQHTPQLFVVFLRISLDFLDSFVILNIFIYCVLGRGKALK